MSAQTVTMRNLAGDAVEVPVEEVSAAVRRGFTPETEGARYDRIGEQAREEEYGGIGDQILAGGAGIARGATLGLSDVILSGLGTEGVSDELRNLRQQNRGTSLATEILGGIAPAFVTGGAATPAGLLSRGALGVTERVAARGGVGNYVAGAAIGGAIEGGVQNVGSYISDIALENKDLSAEGFLASAGQGALWGGAAGGAFAGIERGTVAARRLFPRSQLGDREALQIADETFNARSADILKQADELETVARSTAEDMRIRGLELNLERARLKQAGDLSPASKIRLKEIDLERAKLTSARKALRAQQNAERAAKGQPDLPEEPLPATPPLDEASVVPTGPPAPLADFAPPAAPVVDAAPSLAGVDSLEARLAATKGLLDEGVPFADIGAAAQGQIDDLSIAAGNNAHEAGILADQAVNEGAAAAERVSAKLDDFVIAKARMDGLRNPERKAFVEDWIAKYKPGAKYTYTSSLTGDALSGGAPVRTDRTRVMADVEDAEAFASDRVFAGIGEARDAAPTAPAPPLSAPAGFDAAMESDGMKLFTGRPSVQRGIPSHADAGNYRTQLHVVRPSELLDVPLFGTTVHPNRIASVRSAWDDGKKLPVIEIDVTPSGRYSVQDGNHRIMAAAADDREIAVRFRPSQEEFAADYASDISKRIKEALPKQPTGLASRSAGRLSEDASLRSVKRATDRLKTIGVDRDAEDLISIYKAPPGYEVHFDQVGAIDDMDGVSLRAVIKDESGNDAGKLQRELFRDENGDLVAFHSSIDVDEAHRGKGISDSLTASSLQGYADMGVRRVDLDATWVGRYQWLKAGWTPTSPDEIVDGFRTWAKKQPDLAGRVDDLIPRVERAVLEPGELANLDIDGLKFKTPLHPKERGAASGSADFHAGKAFLLSRDAPSSFRATLKIDPADAHYQYATKHFGIGAKAPRQDARATGADLDSAYDDLIEQASNADDAAALRKIAEQAGELEEEILSRVESRGGREAAEVARIRAKRAEYNWTAADVAARRAEKLGIAKATGEGPAPVSAKRRGEQADLEAYERVVRANQGRGDMAHSYPSRAKTAGEVAEEILGEARALTEPATPAVPAGLGRFIDDADETIRVVGEFERAQYELAQELGPAAPPAIQQHAAEYAAALDDQARKSTETLAASADDAVKATSPAATVDPKRAASLVALPKAPPMPAGASKRAGGIADAMGYLEVANMLGDIPGLPSAQDLPVIGPVLSYYLKYRAAKAVYHRFTGRIGASPAAKVAIRSAEIRDKAAGIVDSLLEGASKGAKYARQPVAAGGTKLLDSLKYSLYPDGSERKEQKSPAEATKARVAELSAAVANPEAVKAAVRKQVGATNPDLAAAIESAALRKLQYLQKHAPKQPTPGAFGAKPWHLSTGEMERFARRVRAAEDPLSVLSDLERGTITVEAADTLRVVYPQIFSEVQTRLLTRAAELEAKLPYQRLVHLSLLFDAPLDDSLKPENLAILQSTQEQAGPGPSAAGQPAGQPPAPSVAAPVNLSRLYETSEMRRATRR